MHDSTLRLHGTGGTGRTRKCLGLQKKKQVNFFTGTVLYFARTRVNTLTVQLFDEIAQLMPGI